MVSDAEVAAFRRDGFLVIRGLIGGPELDALRQAAGRVMEQAVTRGRELDEQEPVAVTADHGFWDTTAADPAGFLYGRDPAGRRVWRRAEALHTRDRAFRATTANPAIIHAVERVHGAPVLPGNDALVVKMPGAGAAVPWHRDPSGEKLLVERGDASSDFTCDIYLDESTVDNGCLYAIAGSHRSPAPGPVAQVSDELDFTRPDAVALEAAPGDVLLHSTGVLHGSPANAGRSLRRTFYIHYQLPSVIKQVWGRDDAWISARSEQLAAWATERDAVVA